MYMDTSSIANVLNFGFPPFPSIVEVANEVVLPQTTSTLTFHPWDRSTVFASSARGMGKANSMVLCGDTITGVEECLQGFGTRQLQLMVETDVTAGKGSNRVIIMSEERGSRNAIIAGNGRER